MLSSCAQQATVVFIRLHVPYLEYAFTFTFSHLADAFIQSDLQLENT